MRSAAAGDIARVNELLEYKTKVNSISTIGSTALMYAAKNGHDEVVIRLLEAGSDPSLKTHKGHSALDLARKSGHESTVQLLR
ncbi:Ankyrin repeats (3 copies) [compost metagenome]